MVEVRAPLTGTVVRVVEVGTAVGASTPVVVIESMKMEYGVDAGTDGTVAELRVAVGDTVQADAVLAVVTPGAVEVATDDAADHGGRARHDLAEVIERHAVGLDERRPDAVERRRRTGQRTARENVDDLVDPGSFVEYGPLVIAAQRRRRSVGDLIARTPADGLVAGVATVDGRPTAVLSYDYTVLAGTQCLQNHRK